jgi:hypothetical protein
MHVDMGQPGAPSPASAWAEGARSGWPVSAPVGASHDDGQIRCGWVHIRQTRPAESVISGIVAYRSGVGVADLLEQAALARRLAIMIEGDPAASRLLRMAEEMDAEIARLSLSNNPAASRRRSLRAPRP